MDFTAADEGRHAPDAHPWFQEGWEFDAWWDGGRAGVTVRVTLWPAQRRLWYAAALVRPGAPVVTVVELDAPLPSRTLELRAPALWADHICETPMAHWSVNNEAHGVALDDPDDAYGRAYGVVVPVAFELEWEDETGPRDAVPPGGTDLTGYAVDSRVHGDVHVGRDVLAVVDAAGRRRHWWGVRGWFAEGWGTPSDGPARLAVPLRAPGLSTRLEVHLDATGWHESNRPDAAH